MSKTIYIKSLGCPKNEVDSEVFAHIAQRQGYQLTDDLSQADLLLLNTCGFIADAINETIYELDTLCEIKKQHPDVRIVVTGCAVKRVAEILKCDFPEVDNWLALKDFHGFEQLLSAEGNSVYQRLPLSPKPYVYLRISDGCNNHCAYCTIPSIRGSLTSVPLEFLVKEAKAMLKPDISELILIAQDVADYGTDLYGTQKLPELLEKLHEIEEYKWMRLMYLHPAHITDELIETCARLPKILPVFEIPLQHCNDKILERMNRRYGKSDMLNLLHNFRQAIPDAEFRTTFITGLPGEGIKEFRALKQFIRDIPFLRMGMFAYSPEPETPAFDMQDRVSHRTARKRQDELLALQSELTEQHLAHYVGKTIQVIVEETNTASEENIGRAWFDAPEIDGTVYIKGENLHMGEIINVVIDDIVGFDLFGHQV